MRINEHTALLTSRVLLVPYSAHHVPAYHEWMQDPAIREATASEPLTLDEEYAMQRSWREDGDKLTFIVCVPPPDDDDHQRRQTTKIQGKVHDISSRMIGDVNLFLVPDDEDEDEDEQHPIPNGTPQASVAAAAATRVIGELEIMIASAAHQNRGLGAAVLSAFLTYVRRHLDGILAEYAASTAAGESGQDGNTTTRTVTLKHLRVKIGAANGRSLRLFEKVGFVRVSEVPNFFDELELRRRLVEGVDGEGKRSLGAEEVVELGYEVVES